MHGNEPLPLLRGVRGDACWKLRRLARYLSLNQGIGIGIGIGTGLVQCRQHVTSRLLVGRWCCAGEPSASTARLRRPDAATGAAGLAFALHLGARGVVFEVVVDEPAVVSGLPDARRDEGRGIALPPVLADDGAHQAAIREVAGAVADRLDVGAEGAVREARHLLVLRHPVV